MKLVIIRSFIENSTSNVRDSESKYKDNTRLFMLISANRNKMKKTMVSYSGRPESILLNQCSKQRPSLQQTNRTIILFRFSYNCPPKKKIH